MVYNCVLILTIGNSVMASIVFFLACNVIFSNE